ncbi:hypothetical protein M8J77_018115 [Diaphorina citri]|nr:hypothetical protein M8J77_018115 [Diaphorina citri]
MVDTERYISQLEKRLLEQEQLIALLNEKIASLESRTAGVVCDSFAGVVKSGTSGNAGGGAPRRSQSKSKPGDSLMIIGSRKTDIDSVPNVQSFQLFVTRIAPETSSQKLGETLLSSVPDLTSVRCSKLKTKHESYTSFHVVVPDHQSSLVSCEEAWPEGALIKRFSGKLLKSYVVEAFDSTTPGDSGSAPAPSKASKGKKTMTNKVAASKSKNTVAGVGGAVKSPAKARTIGTGVDGVVKSPLTGISPKNTRSKDPPKKS